MEELDLGAVGGIINARHAHLNSARCPEFKEDAVQQRVLRIYVAGIEGLVVIGGDGSYRGAMDLVKKASLL